jgi:hypothetical protein
MPAGFLHLIKPSLRSHGESNLHHENPHSTRPALEPKRLITHRFHYSEMVQAYEMAYAREKSMVGVIFSWEE